MLLRDAVIRCLVPGLLVACAGEPKPVSPPSEAATPEASDTAPDSAEPGGDPTDSGAHDSGSTTPAWDEGDPPVVVLFIGDGMGSEHLRGAGLVENGEAGTLFLESAPHRGWLQTASLSGYTDSAASATTMATGHKTLNGRIGQDAHGNELEGLVDIAHLRGLSVGVVTTDTLTGATPSSFLTHAGSRYDTEAIALSLSADPPEVMLGGGAAYLLEKLAESPALVVQSAEELAAAPVDLSRSLVGLVADRELPFLADMDAEDTTPRLPAMVSTALDHLLTDPDGLLLIVEGARIDHASHFNRTDAVFHEVNELDRAVQETVERLGALEGREVTVLVTADHECGGLTIRSTELDAGTGLPEVTWTWGDHTNRDVPIFGWGDAAGAIAGDRRHNAWVWSALDGALRSRAAVEPTLPRLPDGALDDLGAPVVVQTIETDFGAGFNQLDALRVTADARGIWVGVDGVFDQRANGVVVWLDLDPGAGTGVGADLELVDPTGVLDRFVGAPAVSTTVAGLGFDAAVGEVGASYARTTATRDVAGVRQFQPPMGTADDLAWKLGAVNFDDGNLADREPARDAAATGATAGGMEVLVEYGELWDGGLPAGGATVSLVVTLGTADGRNQSNQALPPQDVRAGEGTLVVSSVVTFTVDGAGNVVDGPRVGP